MTGKYVTKHRHWPFPNWVTVCDFQTGQNYTVSGVLPTASAARMPKLSKKMEKIASQPAAQSQTITLCRKHLDMEAFSSPFWLHYCIQHVPTTSSEKGLCPKGVGV
jgi:hypothetical protein